MIARWVGDRFLADRGAVAGLYGVSERTVRRRCQPVEYDEATGVALYDAFAAETTLAGVVGRPERTAAATRARVAAAAAKARGAAP